MPRENSSRQSGLFFSSSAEPAWIVASSLTPQPPACRIAARSSGCVISSTASHCGFILRSSMHIPSPFGQPESTSVHGPRSNCGTPCTAPASSSRSSATAMRCPVSESARMQLRSSVVFPLPGAPASRQDPCKYGSSCSGGCRMACGTRSARDEISRMPVIQPFCTTALPQTPSRYPPGRLRYPPRSCSCTAYCDCAEAFKSICCNSACDSVSRTGSARSAPMYKTDGLCPTRSRSSSICASGMPASAVCTACGSIRTIAFCICSPPVQVYCLSASGIPSS